MLSHMQAKGLSAGYNGEAVFRGLDLKIPEGSITTLIGSNGSGKSTILKNTVPDHFPGFRRSIP